MCRYGLGTIPSAPYAFTTFHGVFNLAVRARPEYTPALVALRGFQSRAGQFAGVT